jgi:galactose-3-O-sulfotransferase
MAKRSKREDGAPDTAREQRLGWLEAVESRLPDSAVVWDLGGRTKGAAALFSKRHRYCRVVPDGDALAAAHRRRPNAHLVEGTWATVEIEPGTADAVIAAGRRVGASSADLSELVARAASWLKPGGYLLVNASPREVPAYAPNSWLDAADEAEPRRAIPTEGVLHEAGLEVRDYELSPTQRGTQRSMWLLAARPTTAPRPQQPRRLIDLPRRPQPLTVFIHIPKAAGTTFTQILRANYPPGTVGHIGNLFKGSGGLDPKVLERMKLAEERTMWMHVVAGHLPLGIRHALPADTRYVTFLREPADRILSHYHVLITLRRGPNATLPELDESTPLEDVLADGRFIFDNLQTRMLSGDPEPLGEVTRETLDRAKENLRSGSVVFGLTERFDESLVLIGRALGLQELAYRRRRVNSDRPRTVSDEISASARDFDRFDVELYEYARGLFVERVAALGDGFANEVCALQEARATLEAEREPRGEPGTRRKERAASGRTS